MFGKAVFRIRCLAPRCKQILGEVDDKGQIRIKSKRVRTQIFGDVVTLFCSNCKTTIKWISKKYLK